MDKPIPTVLHLHCCKDMAFTIAVDEELPAGETGKMVADVDGMALALWMYRWLPSAITTQAFKTYQALKDGTFNPI